jgi:hypothetical protein
MLSGITLTQYVCVGSICVVDYRDLSAVKKKSRKKKR